MPIVNRAYDRGWKVARYNRALTGFEWAFWIFVLVYATGAIFPLWLSGKPSAVEATEVTPKNTNVLQQIWAVTYLFFGLYVLSRLEQLYKAVKENPGVLVILPLVMIASTVYAATPPLSFQRAVTTIITSGMGMYLGVRYSLRDIAKLMCWALTISMLASFFVMIFMHNLGVMEVAVPGAWAGAFLHKNSLGHMALLDLVFFGYFFMTNKGYFRLTLIGLTGMIIYLMIGAKSTTADIGIPLLLGAAYVLNSLKRSSQDFALITLGAIVAIGSLFPLLTLLYAQVLDLLGKDMTLTGRTDLWALAIESFLHKPFIGWGYDNFWESTEPYGGLSIRAQMGWMVPSAHNSWLELGLQIGIIGVVLYARMLFATLHRALTMARMTLQPEYALVLVYVFYLLMFSAGERVFLLRNDIRHIILVAFFVATWRDLRFAQGPVDAAKAVVSRLAPGGRLRRPRPRAASNLPSK